MSRLSVAVSREAQRGRVVAAVETFQVARAVPTGPFGERRVVSFLYRCEPGLNLAEVVDLVVDLQKAGLSEAAWAYDAHDLGEGLYRSMWERRRGGFGVRAPLATHLGGGRERSPGTLPVATLVDAVRVAEADGALTWSDGTDAALRREAIQQLAGWAPAYSAADGVPADAPEWAVAISLAVYLPGRGARRYISRGGGTYWNREVSPDVAY